MKKLCTLLLSSLFVLSSFDVTAAVSGFRLGNSVSWRGNYQDALKQARADNKPVLILFTGTSWCPACKKLEKEVINNPEFSQGLADRFIFYKAEFNDGSQQGIMKSVDKPLLDRYNVTTFPTFVVVDANGNKLFTVNYKQAPASSYVAELNQRIQGR